MTERTIKEVVELPYSEWPDANLIEAARDYYYVINIMECFSPSDLHVLYLLEQELQKRGLSY
jgi:hypothetical protein